MAVGQAEGSRRASALWGSAFVLGIVIMALGVVALIATIWTGIASVITLGLVIGVSGLAQIFHAIGSRKTESLTGHMLAGILSLVVGVLIAARPVAGLAAITMLLIGYFFVAGLFRVVTSALDRYAKWGFDFAYGIATIILGVIMVGNWPSSALWLVGTLVGLEIIFRGASLTANSLALRSLLHEARANA